MRRGPKKYLTVFIVLCLCVCMTAVLPASASADTALDKVLVAMPTTPIAYAPSGSITASSSTQGCSVQSITWYDAYGSAFSGSFGTGSYTVEITVALADGYYLADNVRVYLNNSSVDFTVSGSRLIVRRAYTPAIWTPDIYKHPEGETVTEGGFASFAASGAYYENVNWRIYNPDATSYYTVDQAVEKFPGLTTGGDGWTTLNLYNIPIEMNGWRVAAYFSNPGGGRESYGAVITVKADPAKATPTPAPTAEPTPEPSAAPDDTPATPDPDDENHRHEFSETWEYDDNEHWHACACGEKADAAAHDMQWTPVRAASKDADGEERGVCSVCGYTGTRRVEYTGKGLQMGEGSFKYVVFGILGLMIILVAVKMLSDGAGRRRRHKHRRSGYQGKH